MRIRPGIAIAVAGALSGCATTPRPAPVAVVAAPAATPTVVAPPPVVVEWQDLPLTAGAWTYAGDATASAARFGAEGTPAFTLRCDRQRHVVTLERAGAIAGATMAVRTSYSTATWPVGAKPGGAPAVILAAADPVLDRMAFSRGRFSVSVAGMPTLMLPTWAEPARVIEDCRS